jgi:hypothetical protein
MVSKPGRQAFKVAGSCNAAQTFSLGAGINLSPDMSMKTGS